MKILSELAQACRTINFAASTEECYCRWIEDDLRYHRRIAGVWVHPDELRERHVEAYLTYLAVERQLAASSQSQAMCALVYFYEQVLKGPLGQIAAFRAKRSTRRPRSLAPDRLGAYPKPPHRPAWMTDDAARPATLTVREVRVRIRTPNRRVQSLVLVTTRLDRRRCPAKDLAQLDAPRWQVEVDLRPLKTTLGIDVLKSKTLAGVREEVRLFGLASNLVRRVMPAAAARPRGPAERIRFPDAPHGRRQARPGAALPNGVVVPRRAGRGEPRVKKLHHRNDPLLNPPRRELKTRLENKGLIR